MEGGCNGYGPVSDSSPTRLPFSTDSYFTLSLLQNNFFLLLAIELTTTLFLPLGLPGQPVLISWLRPIPSFHGLLKYGLFHLSTTVFL